MKNFPVFDRASPWHSSLHWCATNLSPIVNTVTLWKGSVIVDGIHPSGLSESLSLTTKSDKKHNLSVTFPAGKQHLLFKNSLWNLFKIEHS